jgi:hypothetical protein
MSEFGGGAGGSTLGNKSSGLLVAHTVLVATLQIARGRGQAAMTQQELNGAYIGAGLEQVGGERVPAMSLGR